MYNTTSGISLEPSARGPSRLRYALYPVDPFLSTGVFPPPGVSAFLGDTFGGVLVGVFCGGLGFAGAIFGGLDSFTGEAFLDRSAAFWGRNRMYFAILK